MAAFEDSYKSPLQGVSQQLPKDRLDGQVTEQINMLSDPVTNLRRRTGIRYANSISMPSATVQSVVAWATSIGSSQYEIIVDAATGSATAVAYDPVTRAYSTTLTFTDPYLVATDARSLSAVSVNTELFLINTEKVMGKGATGGPLNPIARGFVEIKAGAFSTTFSVKLTNKSGGSYTASYTTPNGTTAGDSDLATPAYIASQLAAAVTAAPSFGSGATVAGVLAYAAGPSVFFLDPGPGAFQFKSEGLTGRTLMTASGAGYLADASSLPAQLANEADGYVISTTSASTPVYYKYVAGKQSWLETADYITSFATLTNSPISIFAGTSGLSVDPTPFEGRLAGNPESSPEPMFVGKRITGTGSYQGRLVLMCGNTVYMSASGKPRRFFRSTVTAVLDGDTIGIASSAASGAEWRQSLEYNKDLLLFSANYQGLVGGSSSAVTPRTAAVLVNSKYDGDVLAQPVNIGRTVMFPVPVSDAHFGMMEMLESQYADSKYSVYDSTVHLPTYMVGRCRVAVASSAARVAAFLSDTELNTVIVHEFQWDGDTKRQQAWHKWTFKYPVSSAFFIGGRLHLVFVRNGLVSVFHMDPRYQPRITDPVYNAPLDFSTTLDLVGGQAAIPSWMLTSFPEDINSVVAAAAVGPLASEPVGIRKLLDNFVTTFDTDDTKITVGFPFLSRVEFGPPVLKDHNGSKITTNKCTVMRFIMGTNASREFDISVSDNQTTLSGDGPVPYSVSPLYFSDPELNIGEALVGGPNSGIIIPARTICDSTRLIASSSGTGEMNITSLEFALRYKERIQRRKG